MHFIFAPQLQLLLFQPFLTNPPSTVHSNDLVSKLDELNKAGNETYTQVPVELLVHLDEEPMQATPETFQAHKLGARVEEKKAIDARIDYLKQLQTALAQIPPSSSVTEG